jgi:hypothetical protein
MPLLQLAQENRQRSRRFARARVKFNPARKNQHVLLVPQGRERKVGLGTLREKLRKYGERSRLEEIKNHHPGPTDRS